MASLSDHHQTPREALLLLDSKDIYGTPASSLATLSPWFVVVLVVGRGAVVFFKAVVTGGVSMAVVVVCEPARLSALCVADFVGVPLLLFPAVCSVSLDSEVLFVCDSAAEESTAVDTESTHV